MNYENVPRCNILFLGRTGAGCSSLINYLFGTDAPTGTGAPVTGVGEASERGMDRYGAEAASGMRLGVFDTRGIAAGDISEWKGHLCDAYQRLCLVENTDAAFHIVVYCIGDKRVQEVDAKVIAWFIANGCKTVVALTQADTRTAEQAEAMRQAVIQSVGEALRGEDAQGADADELKLPQTEMPPLDAVSVCSVGKAFGREELLEAIMGDPTDIVARVLSHQIARALCERLRTHVDGECAALTVLAVRSNVKGYRDKKIVRGYCKRLDAFMKALLSDECKVEIDRAAASVMADSLTSSMSDEALSAAKTSGEKKHNHTLWKVVSKSWQIALAPARKLCEIGFKKDRMEAIYHLTLRFDAVEEKAQRQVVAFLPQIRRGICDVILEKVTESVPLIEQGGA